MVVGDAVVAFVVGNVVFVVVGIVVAAAVVVVVNGGFVPVRYEISTYFACC